LATAGVDACFAETVDRLIPSDECGPGDVEAAVVTDIRRKIADDVEASWRRAMKGLTQSMR
jgi:hypothetical protein